MSDSALKTPFDALRRTFIISDQPQQSALLPTQDSRVRGHAFSIGAFDLVVDTVRCPCEIYEELPLCRLPGSPAHLAGMANQRGNIVPIFNIHSLLETQANEQRVYYLIIGHRDDAVGFQIDSLPKHVALTKEESVTTSLPIPQLLEPFIHQFYQQGERLYADWDAQGFITSLATDR